MKLLSVLLLGGMVVVSGERWSCQPDIAVSCRPDRYDKPSFVGERDPLMYTCTKYKVLAESNGIGELQELMSIATNETRRVTKEEAINLEGVK